MVVADRDPAVVSDHEGPVVAPLHVELDVVHPEREGRLERVEGVLQVPVLPGAEPVGADQHRVPAPAKPHGPITRLVTTGTPPRPAPARRAGRRRPRSPGATARRRRSGRPAASIASSGPVGGVRRRPRSPGASRTDWWWWQSTVSDVARPASRAASPRRCATVDRRRTRRRRGCARRGRPRRACAGRARRRRAPPSPACPRQTPSTGRPAASAASSSASSQASRSGRQLGGARVRLLAVAGRVDVGAAGDHQPVEPRDHGVRGAGARRRAAAAPVRRRRATTASAYCAGSTSARWSHTPQRRLLAVGGQADERAVTGPQSG